MAEKHLTVASWKLAKAEAEKDPNFKKSKTGIQPALKDVEATIKKKLWVKAPPLLTKLREKCSAALLDSSKKQKNKGKSAGDQTYINYTKYIKGIIEEVDKTLLFLNEQLEVDATSKRKRQPADLTIDLILGNKKLLDIFRSFCVNIHEEAQIEYVKDMVVRKNKPSQKIYDRYFKEGAKLRVNVYGKEDGEDVWHKANETQEWNKVDPKKSIAHCKNLLAMNAVKKLREGDGKKNLQLWVNKMCDV